jgi:hypothetical protein
MSTPLDSSEGEGCQRPPTPSNLRGGVFCTYIDGEFFAPT